ncbi:uncharacterized protein LOC111272172 isoform X3 [Varroa jacobsoni]|uniref:uncharacterized protein LOC111272172 isoform X3 n=1 Tax=Varroa jacobsoni TaxID=62625 RepID=UPI000BF97512|nr:uncharacterized protein LOC111272172 isoform X3 [Varroa jacobsoni]
MTLISLQLFVKSFMVVASDIIYTGSSLRSLFLLNFLEHVMFSLGFHAGITLLGAMISHAIACALLIRMPPSSMSSSGTQKTTSGQPFPRSSTPVQEGMDEDVEAAGGRGGDENREALSVPGCDTHTRNRSTGRQLSCTGRWRPGSLTESRQWRRNADHQWGPRRDSIKSVSVSTETTAVYSGGLSSSRRESISSNHRLRLRQNASAISVPISLFAPAISMECAPEQDFEINEDYESSHATAAGPSLGRICFGHGHRVSSGRHRMRFHYVWSLLIDCGICHRCLHAKHVCTKGACCLLLAVKQKCFAAKRYSLNTVLRDQFS